MLPTLTPAQLRHLSERDHRRHFDYVKTIIHYRGRKFTVDGIVLSLRLWFGKTRVPRRFGWGL